MGEEVFPVLATIILVATLITLIVAIASYIVFRVKEVRRSKRGTPVEDVSIDTAEQVSQSTPHRRRADTERDQDDTTPARQRSATRDKRTPESQEESTPAVRRKRDQDDEEDIDITKKFKRKSDEVEDIDTSGLGRAQSAFLKNYKFDDEEESPERTKFKRFSLKDPPKPTRKPKSNGDSDDAKWK